MKVINDMRFDEERALYASKNLILKNCSFDGEKDGESAIKECKNIISEDCYFNLRYPMWHVNRLQINNAMLTQNCRAAIWYSKNVNIKNSNLLGIKAIRECNDVYIENSKVVSPEFGWSARKFTAKNCDITSEYFMLRSSEILLDSVKFNGKYSFQYIKDAEIIGCDLQTKDAFWHSKNVTVKNSLVKGEYLGWYSDGLTLINCVISGTQPLCYCKNLTLIDCTMQDCDLSFEKSEVNATILNTVDSIKNPYKGTITVKGVGEVIIDDKKAKANIIISK